MPTWEEIGKGIPSKAKNIVRLASQYVEKEKEANKFIEKGIPREASSRILRLFTDMKRIVNRLENIYVSFVREHLEISPRRESMKEFERDVGREATQLINDLKERTDEEEMLEEFKDWFRDWFRKRKEKIEETERLERIKNRINNIEEDIKTRRQDISKTLKEVPEMAEAGRTGYLRKVMRLLAEFSIFMGKLKNVMINTKREWIKRYDPPSEKERNYIFRRFKNRLKYFNDVSKSLIFYAKDYGYEKDKQFLKENEQIIIKKYRKYILPYIGEKGIKKIKRKYEALDFLINKDFSKLLNEYDIRVPKDSIFKGTESNYLSFMDRISKEGIIFDISRLKAVVGDLEKKYSKKTIRNSVFGMSQKLKTGFWNLFCMFALRGAGLVPKRIKVERGAEVAMERERSR